MLANLVAVGTGFIDEMDVFIFSRAMEASGIFSSTGSRLSIRVCFMNAEIRLWPFCLPLPEFRVLPNLHAALFDSPITEFIECFDYFAFCLCILLRARKINIAFL